MMESDNQIHINKLPREVLHNIFSQLGYRDLISVGRTCKHLHSLSKDDVLLQRIAQTEYSRTNHNQYSEEEIGRAVFLGIMSLKLV